MTGCCSTLTLQTSSRGERVGLLKGLPFRVCTCVVVDSAKHDESRRWPLPPWRVPRGLTLGPSPVSTGWITTLGAFLDPSPLRQGFCYCRRSRVTVRGPSSFVRYRNPSPRPSNLSGDFTMVVRLSSPLSRAERRRSKKENPAPSSRRTFYRLSLEGGFTVFTRALRSGVPVTHVTEPGPVSTRGRGI